MYIAVFVLGNSNGARFSALILFLAVQATVCKNSNDLPTTTRLLLYYYSTQILLLLLQLAIHSITTVTTTVAVTTIECSRATCPCQAPREYFRPLRFDKVCRVGIRSLYL
jgi:hypothetical protein